MTNEFVSSQTEVTSVAKLEPLLGSKTPEQVYVRMYRALEEVDDKERKYRGLLGDCFLIRLQSGDAQSTILIDCGILLGSFAAKLRMQAIAADIVKECRGNIAEGKPGVLDLVVVTHEHWDHISGFSQASEILLNETKLVIKNVWMAWTEDPEDSLAQKLRTRFDKSAAAFSMLGQRLRKSARFGEEAAQNVLHGLDGFMGLAADSGDQRPLHLAGRDIIERLKKNNPSYLTPGEVRATPGVVSLRTFVLGPPHNEERLFKDKPSTKKPETYFDELSIDGKHLFKFATGIDPDPTRDSPFAPPYCRHLDKDMNTLSASGSLPDDEVREFVQSHYYGDPDMNPTALADLVRRQIDTDWLGGASALALKLDSDTNNTSLVLAFELPDSDRSVMLFAADAQVGNWESWHDQTYLADDSEAPITAENLLNRTKLYKVGHHGSHNATLKEKGLEMMKHPDLFAMLPTDEELGKTQGSSGWQMPNPRLKMALREQTKGRILRNDRLHSPEARRNDPDLKEVESTFFDSGKLTETDLFLEYRLL